MLDNFLLKHSDMYSKPNHTSPNRKEYVAMFIELLLTDDVTPSYNLGQIVCNIEQSVYDSERIVAVNKGTRRFGHILLGERELESANPEVANRVKDENRVSGCRAAEYNADVHGACSHPDTLPLVECYR